MVSDWVGYAVRMFVAAFYLMPMRLAASLAIAFRAYALFDDLWVNEKMDGLGYLADSRVVGH